MRRRSVAQRLPRRCLRPLKLSGRRHADGRVDEHQVDRRAQRSRRLREIRARKRKREKTERRHPQREEHQLAQPAAARLLHRRAAQVAHRGEVDHRFRAALEQMNGDRNRRGRQAGEKQW
jgi:hypothetical protein